MWIQAAGDALSCGTGPWTPRGGADAGAAMRRRWFRHAAGPLGRDARCGGPAAAARSRPGVRTDRDARVRGLVPQPGRDVQPLLRLLQPQHRGSHRGPDRAGQPDRAARPGPRTTRALRASPPLGRVRGECARGFRRPEGRVDARRAGPDVRHPGQPETRLGDRCAGRRGGLGQHAAGAALRSGRAGRAGAGRHRQRSPHGGCGRAARSRGVGDGRRPRAQQHRGRGQGTGAGHAHLAQAPRPGRRGVLGCDTRRRGGRPGGDDGDVQCAG